MAVIPDLKIKVPQLQLDGIPIEAEVKRAEASRAFTLQLTLSVPDVQRFSTNPDSNLVFAAISEAIASHSHRIRLTLISDKEVESEFERLQDDGSVRDLMPGEGTW